MWEETNNKLRCEYQFKDFTQAFAFMVKVAAVIDAHDHHPTWTNTYNTVSFALSTHDQGDIVTEKDRVLAKAIGDVYRSFSRKS